MIERIIEIADTPARLSVRNDLLIIEREESEVFSVPLKELAVLVIAHPQVLMSQAVLAGVAEAGGTIVACNRRRLPAAMTIPLAGHALQSERFRKQAELGLPRRKRLWQQLIQAKIRAQAHVLIEETGSDTGLEAMARQVRSGDPENKEAQAAKRYWKALAPKLSGDTFARNPDGPPPNDLLNYGYAILRATTARAICSAGLHPTFGLHHSNRANPFCLADDLMEPLRPRIDQAAVHWLDQRENAPLDKETKTNMLSALTQRVTIENNERTLFDALSICASSLANVIMGNRKELILPEL